ncbi:hypothetical protein ACFLT8_01680 [Chloroflexota bacterium]
MKTSPYFIPALLHKPLRIFIGMVLISCLLAGLCFLVDFLDNSFNPIHGHTTEELQKYHQEYEKYTEEVQKYPAEWEKRLEERMAEAVGTKFYTELRSLYTRSPYLLLPPPKAPQLPPEHIIEYERLTWAIGLSACAIILGATLGFYVAGVIFIVQLAEYHKRNVVTWTTASILFTPVLAIIAYLLTCQNSDKLSPKLLQTLPSEVQEFWEMKTGKELKVLQSSPARRQRLEKHWANLAIVAEGLLSNFEKIRLYSDFVVVGNVVDGGTIDLDGLPAPFHFSKSARDDSQRLEKIDGYLTQRLLEHLKKKCHVLSNINDWRELPWSNISDELLEKLSFLAHGGVYKGTTCEWCLQNDLESE